MFRTLGVTWTATTLLGGSTVGTDVDKGSADGSVEGPVGGSINLVMIVLLLVAVEVGGAMLVTSKEYQQKAWFLVTTTYTACTCMDRSINHKHKYAHQHKMLYTLCMVKDAVTNDWPLPVLSPWARTPAIKSLGTGLPQSIYH